MRKSRELVSKRGLAPGKSSIATSFSRTARASVPVLKCALWSVVGALLLGVAAGADEPEPVRLAEPWNAPYAGEDATGDHVAGLWSFDAPAELTDSSPNGHDLTLHGARIAGAGRFGGCLESGRGWPDADQPHQARAPAASELTPQGPFSVEMWIKPKPEIEGYPDSFLLDNRYVDESGLQLILTGDSGAGRRLRMILGTAGDHPAWTSDQYVFAPGEWHHVAFTYDARGDGRFYVDGEDLGGESRPEFGAVTAGVKSLTIGDRVGSLYHGFPGYIDQVRICRGVLEFSPATFQLVSPRRVFMRMEPATLRLELVNRRREALADAKVTLVVPGVARRVRRSRTGVGSTT